MAKDSDGERVLCSRENIPTSEFTIRLTEPDQYVLGLKAVDHAGSDEFYWRPEASGGSSFQQQHDC